MKLGTKLFVCFTVLALLLGVIGFVALKTNRTIKHHMSQVVESNIHEVEGATEMVLALQRLQTATQELMGETYKGVVEPEEKVAAAAAAKSMPFSGMGLEKLMAQGSIRELDFIYKTKAGEEIPVSFSGSVLRDKAGMLVGVIGVAKDMREIQRLMAKEKSLATAVAEVERKRVKELEKAQDASLTFMEDLEFRRKEVEQREQQLKETQAMLVQAGKLSAVGQLGAGVAHGLNQPLTAIKGFAQVMRGELSEGDRHSKDVDKIVEQAHRMSLIIDNLRDFTRESKGKMMEIDIHKPIEDALMLMNIQLKDHGIELIREFGDSLPKIWGESNQLQQVFINIIGNAKDVFDEQGRGGKIWVETRPKDKSQKAVEVIFRNNGPPIPQEAVHRIFDPFFTTKEVGKGTGLGLSISYGIIQAHQGEIEAINLPAGKGVEFRVTVPSKTV